VSAGIVTLLTDFGLSDGYVGAMKGSMLARQPQLRFVDLSHEIPPGDLSAAAYVLLQAAPHFPDGSVHLVVVDPGVGTDRAALGCGARSQFYVGPDNGVLSWALEGAEDLLVHAISNPVFAPEQASPVFHGRDIFGPAAAHLAAGGALRDLGESLEPAELVRLTGGARRDGDLWTGTVIHVDRFGNLISDIPAAGELRGVVEIVGRSLPVGRTYGDVPHGELLALSGSSQRLEVACNGGSAAQLLGAARGDVIVFRVH
jgi:S-adenosylmethionine hydrolase